MQHRPSLHYPPSLHCPPSLAHRITLEFRYAIGPTDGSSLLDYRHPYALTTAGPDVKIVRRSARGGAEGHGATGDHGHVTTILADLTLPHRSTHGSLGTSLGVGLGMDITDIDMVTGAGTGTGARLADAGHDMSSDSPIKSGGDDTCVVAVNVDTMTPMIQHVTIRPPPDMHAAPVSGAYGRGEVVVFQLVYTMAVEVFSDDGDAGAVPHFFLNAHDVRTHQTLSPWNSTIKILNLNFTISHHVVPSNTISNHLILFSTISYYLSGTK